MEAEQSIEWADEDPAEPIGWRIPGLKIETGGTQS
jgi:hypothetical protein